MILCDDNEENKDDDRADATSPSRSHRMNLAELLPLNDPDPDDIVSV